MILLTRLTVAVCILAAVILMVEGEFERAAYVIIGLIGSIDLILRINRNLTGDELNEGDEEIDEEE